jgi:hypothetical protein
MEIILIVITFISIAAAAVALTAARRVQRSERQRSEARVAALAAAAEAHVSTEGGWTPVAGEWQWTTDQSDPVPSPEARIPKMSPSIAFGTVERGAATTDRLPLFAAAALIMLLGSGLLFLRMSAHETGVSAVQVAQRAEPLELVSLGHSRQVSSLTITGIVRNPVSGHKLEGLTAVVSLLDNNGGLISTKDVPLDYRALGPGEEAPFRVSVPDPGSVARYRVSFRAGTDVVPHVDRRAETKLASALR